MTPVEEQAAALRRLVARLDDAAALLAGIRSATGAVWDDPAGQEWGARLDLVHREMRRLAEETAREVVDDPTDAPELRLPGLTGARTTARRGVVAPALPPMGRAE